MENNSRELLLPYRSMTRPILSVDLYSYAFVKLVGRETVSFVLIVAKSHNWNNQIGPGMIKLLPDWCSLMMVTAWFKFSYWDPNMSLLKQISFPLCSWMAKVLNPLGTCMDLEQKMYMDSKYVRKTMCSFSETSALVVTWWSIIKLS